MNTQDLTPKEQALICFALTIAGNEVKNNAYVAQVKKFSEAVQQPMIWMATELQEIRKKYFPNPYSNELDPLTHFIKETQLQSVTKPNILHKD